MLHFVYIYLLHLLSALCLHNCLSTCCYTVSTLICYTFLHFESSKMHHNCYTLSTQLSVYTFLHFTCTTLCPHSSHTSSTLLLIKICCFCYTLSTLFCYTLCLHFATLCLHNRFSTHCQHNCLSTLSYSLSNQKCVIFATLCQYNCFSTLSHTSGYTFSTTFSYALLEQLFVHFLTNLPKLSKPGLPSTHPYQGKSSQQSNPRIEHNSDSGLPSLRVVRLCQI